MILNRFTRQSIPRQFYSIFISHLARATNNGRISDNEFLNPCVSILFHININLQVFGSKCYQKPDLVTLFAFFKCFLKPFRTLLFAGLRHKIKNNSLHGLKPTKLDNATLQRVPKSIFNYQQRK